MDPKGYPGVGSVSPATGYSTCEITCPVNGEAFAVTATKSSCIARDAASWKTVGCVVATPTGTTVAGIGSVSAGTGYSTCEITCPVNGQAFTVTATKSSCVAKDSKEWTTVGCVVANPTGTTIAAIGSQEAATGSSSCDITCPVNGLAFVVTATENQCIAKDDEQSWAVLGCVAAAPTGITVSALGALSGSTGYSACVITCPVQYQKFVVTATKNSCTAKTEADWLVLGCVVATPTGTTVAGLGSQSGALPEYATCEITCPVDGSAFVVTATKSISPSPDTSEEELDSLSNGNSIHMMMINVMMAFFVVVFNNAW